MNVQGLFLPILQLFMVSLRVGSIWMFFPILGQRNLPNTVKLAGALTLSMALYPLVKPHLPAWDLAHLPNASGLVFFISKELVVGLGMGLCARWIFTACVASAHWVGMQMGFSAGSMVNPELEQNETAWAEFNQWIAIMLFLGIGGHWLLIKAVADSYSVDTQSIFHTLGDTSLASQFWVEVGRRFFFWMLKLSGPMVVVVLLLQAALGVLSRFIPQINVWLVSLPITIGIGVLVFTFLSPMYGDALGGLFKETQESSYMWLRFLKGAR